MTVSHINTAKKPQVLGPNGFPLRVLIMECPYDTLLDSEISQNIFHKLLTLKIAGYQAAYPYGVLPVDTTDFIANHIILTEETNDGYIPHTAFKSVSVSRCETHHLKFPAYGLFQITDHADTSHYQTYLTQTLAQAKAAGEEVGYNGSWTVSKQLQKMKDKFNFREASIVFMTGYYQTYNIKHIIAGASAKFKVDQLKTFMGFDYFSHQDTKLPPINLIPYGNDPVYIMHLKKFSTQMLELCEKPEYKALWEQRLIVKSSRGATKIAA